MAAPRCDRARLREQLLQPSLLQRLVWADRDAIAPATNLLQREPMTGGGLAHLDLELGSWRDRIDPTAVLQRRDAKSCGLVDRFRGHLHRVPNAGRTGKADGARPERHGSSAYHIRFIFAYVFSEVGSRLSPRATAFWAGLCGRLTDVANRGRSLRYTCSSLRVPRRGNSSVRTNDRRCA